MAVELITPIALEKELRFAIRMGSTILCLRVVTTLTKNRRTHPDRLELRKFCRWCRKHTAHKETK